MQRETVALSHMTFPVDEHVCHSKLWLLTPVSLVYEGMVLVGDWELGC